MRLLILLGLAVAIVVILAVIGRWLIRHWTGADEHEAGERGRLVATWKVQTKPLSAELTSDMVVWTVLTAIVDGTEHEYARQMVGTVRYNEVEYILKLEELREQAQRRCRSLNSKMDTTPGTMSG